MSSVNHGDSWSTVPTVLEESAVKQALRYRPRRLRAHPALRRMTRETTLEPADFILPLFLHHGANVRREVSSMPGVFQRSADQLAEELDTAVELGLGGVILFGIPARKDRLGREACEDDSLIAEGIAFIKRQWPDLYVISDLCFCEYTDHGHCGPLVDDGRGGAEVDNDHTLALLAEQAICHARAGVDMVAPSGMMDGFVAAVRAGLDDHGHHRLPIMAYSAKYASAFYGPFREAAASTPRSGDRRGYQMDPANAREALREIELDVHQGADIVMVKPALSYLDIIRMTREMVKIPVAAYNVSGEYAMVKAAAGNGWIEERRVVLEILTSIKRAGADIILTYHAKEAARWLAEER